MVVLNISRVLLALEERSGPHTVTALAVIVSSAILFGFTWFSSRGDGALGGHTSLMSVAGIMVLIAGFIGAEAIQEDEEQERAEDAEEAAEQARPHRGRLRHRVHGEGLKIGPGKVRIEEVNTGATPTRS